MKYAIALIVLLGFVATLEVLYISLNQHFVNFTVVWIVTLNAKLFQAAPAPAESLIEGENQDAATLAEGIIL